MNHFSLTIASETSNIAKVENFIEYIIEELKIPEKLRARIALPVIEAVTNSILFRNENDPRKNVKLYAVKGTQKLVITVKDEGKGIYMNKPYYAGRNTRLPYRLNTTLFYINLCHNFPYITSEQLNSRISAPSPHHILQLAIHPLIIIQLLRNQPAE